MKGKIFLCLGNSRTESNYIFFVEKNKFQIFVTISPIISFTDSLKFNDKFLITFLNTLNEYQNSNYPKEVIKTLDKIGDYSCAGELINLVQEIEISSYNCDVILKYIEDNPILNNKKIIFNEIFSFDNDKFIKTYNLFNSYDNIYIRFKGYEKPIKLNMAKKIFSNCFSNQKSSDYTKNSSKYRVLKKD